ncbi:Polycomb group protein Psc, partial [Gryllus bimaculatus]
MVPQLYPREVRRRRDFYARHPPPPHLRPEDTGGAVDPLIFSPTEPFSVALVYRDEGAEEADSEEGSSRGSGAASPATPTPAPPDGALPVRYVSCQAQVPVRVLKKFLRLKFCLAPAHVVELRYKQEALADDLTLMDVAYIYSWKRVLPLRLHYRFLTPPHRKEPHRPAPAP